MVSRQLTNETLSFLQTEDNESESSEEDKGEKVFLYENTQKLPLS